MANENVMANGADDALGEYNEFTSYDRFVAPESKYPVSLAILDTDVTDVKTDDNTGEEYGGVPFLTVAAEVTDGPFKGATIRIGRLKLTPGKTGGYIGFLKGACKQITLQSADQSQLFKFGFSLPAGDPADKEYRTSVREAFRDQFFALSPAKRLDFMLAYLRVKQWEGKKVVLATGINEYESKTINTATGKPYLNSNNTFDGVYSLTDDTNGLAALRRTEFPRQEEAAIAMGFTASN